MAVTFDDLMKGFGVVTVMNACIFVPNKAYFATRNCKTAGKVLAGGMGPEDFSPAYEYIDTLKIANFTMEGPTKTITGGQYINPLVKYGKTMTAEIQDALGRASTLCRFFGAEYDGYYSAYGIGTPVNFEGQIHEYKYDVPKIDTKKYKYVLVRLNGIPIMYGANWNGWNIDEDGNFLLAVYPQSETRKVAYAEDYTPPLGWRFTDKTRTKLEYRGLKDFGIDDNAHIEIFVPTGGRLSITDKYPGPFAIEGDTFYIDQKTGEKKRVFIFIPQFLPDSILTLTQDAEGDATVFDLNGSVSVTDVHDTGSNKIRSIFYEIRDKSFFAKQRADMWLDGTDYTHTEKTN